MEKIKNLLKELAFSKDEIETLLDEEKAEQQSEILKDWQGRYNDNLIEKPEVKDLFKKKYELSSGKEAQRKTRKAVSTDLALGLTNKQIDEMTEDEFSSAVKEKTAKDGDQKYLDLEKQYKEENRLRLEAEKAIEDKVKEAEDKFNKKDIQREVELRKSKVLASKDSTKFNKSDLELIDYAIKGAEFNQNIGFVVEGADVFVTENGEKKRGSDNKFITYEQWLEPTLSKFDIKQKGTPEGGGAAGEGAEAKKELSEAQKRQIEAYEKKGISVHTTV